MGCLSPERSPLPAANVEEPAPQIRGRAHPVVVPRPARRQAAGHAATSADLRRERGAGAGIFLPRCERPRGVRSRGGRAAAVLLQALRPMSSILPTRASWPPWSTWRHMRMGANQPSCRQGLGSFETQEAIADESSALHVVLLYMREHVLQAFNRLSQQLEVEEVVSIPLHHGVRTSLSNADVMDRADGSRVSKGPQAGDHNQGRRRFSP